MFFQVTNFFWSNWKKQRISKIREQKKKVQKFVGRTEDQGQKVTFFGEFDLKDIISNQLKVNPIQSIFNRISIIGKSPIQKTNTFKICFFSTSRSRKTKGI